MASLHQISKFYRSFSGTDTLAFIILPGCQPVVLGSLTTISYSVFRNKKPVINIGRTNINGVTRGSRIFAGTMIFTLINQYWFREIQESISYLANVKELKVDELPLFDIMIVSANEYGSAVSMFIYGIDFTDEAQTISVEDLFTENTFSFVARDISTFKMHNTLQSVTGDRAANIIDSSTSQRFYIMHATTNWQDVAEADRLYREAKVTFYNEAGDRRYEQDWSRELYYSPSLGRKFMGDDVINVQTLLAQRNREYDLSKDEIGAYTEYTANAIKAYQATHGLDATGRVDLRTYISLAGGGDLAEIKRAYCTNKSGAVIYPMPDRSYSTEGLQTIAYGEYIEYTEIVLEADDDGTGQSLYYKTENGYVHVSDMFSAEVNNDAIEFPVLMTGDYGTHVAMLQSMLKALYPDFTGYLSGYYDTKTAQYIKKFKTEYGIDDGAGVVDDKVTYDVWMALRAQDDTIFREISQDGFYIEVTKDPGQYAISKEDILTELGNFNVSMYADSSTPVKISVVVTYEDGQTKTKSTTVDVKQQTGFSFKQFKDVFTYDPQYGDPTTVEFFVYPYNKQSYKWVVDYGEV